MKITILTIVITLSSYYCLAQDNKSKDSIIKAGEICKCDPDDPDPPESPVEDGSGAIPVKSNDQITNEISAKLKSINKVKFKDLINFEILYFLKIDSKGKVTKVEYYRDYPHRAIFRKSIVDYLSRLKFQPAYSIINNNKVYEPIKRLFRLVPKDVNKPIN